MIFQNVKNKHSIFIAAIFLLTRIPFLGWDIINVDAPAWNYRSTQFYAYLKNFNFAETYRSYHPGVTLMWFSGFGIEVFNQIYKFFYGVRAPYYNDSTFPWLHFSQKLPLVFASLLLLLIIYKLLKNLAGVRFSFLFVLALILEPFFVANTRVLHLDALMTLFILVSVLFILNYFLAAKPRRFLVWAGLCASLAVLTKVSAFIILPFDMLLICSFRFFKQKKILSLIRPFVYDLTIFLAAFLAAFIIIFPAMWVDPFNTIHKIVSDGVIGTGGSGHGQIFLGNGTQNPGMLFYIYTLGFRVSPLLLLTFVISIFTFIQRIVKGPKKISRADIVVFVFLILGLLYFAQMAVSIKKVDRYIVLLIPIMTFVGLWGVKGIIKKISLRILTAVLILQLIVLSVPLYPDYFNYANPLLGGLREFLKVFGPMDWGAGYYKVAKFLNNRAETTSDSWLAAFNDQSIDPYFKGRVEQIDKADFSKMQYVILPHGDSYKSEVLNYGFAQIYSVKYGGVDFWYVYENNNPIKY